MPRKNKKVIQRMLPFDEPAPEPRPAPLREAARYEPSAEAVAAFERLKSWLLDPCTGKPATELGDEALRAVEHALLKGKNGYLLRAEDLLEMLTIRNGKSNGDDIPVGIKPRPEEDFQADVEAVLDCLHERILGRGNGR